MKNPPSQTLNNSQVSCTVIKKPGSQIEFEAIVAKDLITSCHSKALKLVGRNLSIPGFRKGKVPDFYILERFPKDFQEKWQEVVMREALNACFKETKIEPLNSESIGFKLKRFSPEEASFSFTFEVAPEVPSVDPTQFKLQEVKRPVVNEQKIQETIRQTLFFYATWNKVEDKAVEEGDFVLLDVDLLETSPSSSLFTNTRFEVSDDSMAKWMKDLLIGKKVGDVLEGTSVPDENADEVEKETLQPQKVKITIKAMEAPVLPEMTPELFKNLGVESEEDLKNKIESLLNKQADDHVKEEKRNQVRDFLLNTYNFDLPSELINNEVRFRVNQLNGNEEFLQHWQTLDKDGQKKMIEVIKTQSEKAVKLFHLCNKMLEDNNLSPADQIASSQAGTQLEALVSQDQMNYNQAPELRRAEALSKQILEQAEDYVIAQATANVVA
jgi:trigger factor